jgi:hypothetical protein
VAGFKTHGGARFGGLSQEIESVADVIQRHFPFRQSYAARRIGAVKLADLPTASG